MMGDDLYPKIEEDAANSIAEELMQYGAYEAELEQWGESPKILVSKQDGEYRISISSTSKMLVDNIMKRGGFGEGE